VFSVQLNQAILPGLSVIGKCKFEFVWIMVCGD
jgi:hypothetical protein